MRYPFHNPTRLFALIFVILTSGCAVLRSSDLNQQDIFKKQAQCLHSIKIDDDCLQKPELPIFANNGLSINDLLDHIPAPTFLTFNTVIIKISKIMGFDNIKSEKNLTKINSADHENGFKIDLIPHCDGDPSDQLWWTGLMQFKMRQYQGAMDCFSQVLQRYPTNIHKTLHIQYFLSHCLIEQKCYSEALSHLYKIRHDENVPSELNLCVTHQIGLCHLKMSNLRQATENFELLINMNHIPNKLKSLALLHHGIIMAHEKKYRAALTNFKRIAALPITGKILRGYVLYNQSLVKYNLGLWEEALKYLYKLKAQAQIDATVRAQMVIVLSCINLNLDRRQLALNMLDQIFYAKNLSPDMKINSLFYRGIVNHALQINQSSLMDYDRVLATPDISDQLKANTLYFRGLVLFDCREYKKSAVDFFELLLLPDLNDRYKATIFQRLGLINMVYRDEQAALHKFDLALSMHSRKKALNISCHYCSALINKYIGSIDRACKNLNYLLTIKNSINADQLSEIYKMLGIAQEHNEA